MRLQIVTRIAVLTVLYRPLVNRKTSVDRASLQSFTVNTINTLTDKPVVICTMVFKN